VDNDDDDDVYNDDDDNDGNDDDNDDDSPPGINDSLALNIHAFRKGYNPSRRQLKKRHKQGGEKRSGSNVVNVARGCNLPSPPRPRAGAGAGADQTTPWSSGGARLHPPPRGGRREVDQTLPRLRGGASLHPPPSKLERK
jgi:hypothetical protein